MGSPAPPLADDSAAHPKIDGDSSNGASAAAEEKKPGTPFWSIEDLDKFVDETKYKKYEADYTYRLMAKYFSDKNACGGRIFQFNSLVDGEVMLANGSPPTTSYVDPLSVFGDLSCCGISVCKAEEAATTSNGKQPFKK